MELLEVFDVVELLDNDHHLLVEHGELERIDRRPIWVESLKVVKNGRVDYVPLDFLALRALDWLSHFFVLGTLPALPALDGLLLGLLVQVKEAWVAVDRRGHNGDKGALPLLLINAP